MRQLLSVSTQKTHFRRDCGHGKLLRQLTIHWINDILKFVGFAKESMTRKKIEHWISW